MSCVVVLTPVVIAAWPVLAAAIAAAATGAGFRVVRKQEAARPAAPKTSVALEVEGAEVVAEGLRVEQEMAVEKEGVRVVFRRDARGRLETCVEGHGRSKDELRAIGEDLAGRVVQQVVYRRLKEEMAARGFATLAEEEGPDAAIRLHVRRYEG
jgi:hypothetical protein